MAVDRHGHLKSLGDAMCSDPVVKARVEMVLAKHGRTAIAVQGVAAVGWQRHRGREPVRNRATASTDPLPDAVDPNDL